MVISGETALKKVGTNRLLPLVNWRKINVFPADQAAITIQRLERTTIEKKNSQFLVLTTRPIIGAEKNEGAESDGWIHFA